MIPVNILIGDRTYRLKIEPSDEELVRNVIKMVNDKIVEFKTMFAGKDMQDYIAMVLIWLATEQRKEGNDLIRNKNASDKLASLESMIDRILEDHSK
ncbi:cell division ZapA family protein [Filimonas lacunae]|nr:cell division ZapA family protein [Filimonas lacunae]